MAKVIKTARDEANELIGTHSSNPILDTSMYEVEFTEGSIDQLTADVIVIAENLFSQLDSEGRQYQLLSEIIDHKSDAPPAIPISNGFLKSQSGNIHPKKNTRGWKFMVEWKDGAVGWVPLKDLKESDPLELAEYAMANNLEEEPAFHWWVRDTLKKHGRIISKIKTNYWCYTHKFGI